MKKWVLVAAVFIGFLKRLVAGAKRAIFLIVDHGPAHRAKKTAAFVDTLGGKLRLFFLPPYSPDRNPVELVWKHLKADTVGRIAVTGKDVFKRKMRSSKTTPQKSAHSINKSAHSINSIRSHPSNTPPECALLNVHLRMD
jgi:transposase